MSSQVKVEDFEVFRQFRAALLKFAQTAEQSLTGAESEIARTFSWLENEQSAYWQGQLRKRKEAVTVAGQALRQKKLYKDSTGRTPSAVEEEKIYARCLAAVEQAQDKIESIRKWIPRLQKANDLYRGGVSHLGATVSGDIPKAVARLDQLAARLEKYVQIEAPAGVMPETAAASEFDDVMSRGGDAATEPPPNTEEAPTVTAAESQNASASANQPEAPAEKEVRNVADGQ